MSFLDRCPPELDAWDRAVDAADQAAEAARCGSTATYSFRKGPFTFKTTKTCELPAGHAGTCSWARGEP